MKRCKYLLAGVMVFRVVEKVFRLVYNIYEHTDTTHTAG